MDPDSDRFWTALAAGDPRFDGWVYCGVKTTGIYCRPSCPARTPKRENVVFFSTAAGAQAAGFRACKRCRPDAVPGSPEWDRRGDLAGRAMRLIADGVVDREGVAGLANRLGYTERHLRRELTAVVGVGPLALARAQRAQTARVLLETTAMPIIEVAFASGFQSVRQFNDTVREVFALTPRALRSDGAQGGGGGGAINLRLPFRAPLDAAGLIDFLGRRAVPGVEESTDGVFRRSLRLPSGTGVVELRPRSGEVTARFWLEEMRDLAAAVARCRSLLDLDADPETVDRALSADALLRPMVREAPGQRVPGYVDGTELALRAVLGQQVSLAAAAKLAVALVEECGEPLAHPRGAVTHAFPSSPAIAEADPSRWPMPKARRETLKRLAVQCSDGVLCLDAGADREESRRRLAEIKGVGPWTVEYIAMRALRDPDAFLPTDAGVRRALARHGCEPGEERVRALSENWRPYRAYAVQHLWASLARTASARLLQRAETRQTFARAPSIVAL